MPTISKARDKWRAQIRRRGYSPVSKVFATKAQAEKWARDIEYRMDRGEFVPANKRITFSDLLSAYRASLGKAPGRSKDAALKLVESRIGKRRLSELTMPAFVDFATMREVDGAGPATILFDFTYIGTVLRHAGPLAGATQEVTQALQNLSAARTFLRHAGRIKDSEERSRRVTQAELNDLLAYWTAHPPRNVPYMDIVLFAIATCTRLSEICNIKWSDLDSNKKTIWIRNRKHPTEKQGNDQLVPLLVHTRVWGLPLDPLRIVARQPQTSERIFPYNPSTVSTCFTRAVKNAELIDLHFHDLRHEGISRMFESGYQIQEVALVSGHKTWELLRRYTQIEPTSLHRH